MNTKRFAEKINKELNAAGFPLNMDERTKAFSKSFKLSAYHANSILLGKMPPSEALLDSLSEEFELNKSDFI